MAFCVLASVRAVSRPGHPRAHPKAEAKAARVIATLKANGGAPNEAAYQEALDLCVYLRQAIHERDGK